MGTIENAFQHQRLIFATSNLHKLHEVRSMAPAGVQIVGLADIGFAGEIPETQNTIEGNSLQKAAFLSKLYNTPCFAEDTGLIIDALNGEPGVYSARYAGEKASYADNTNKVLKKMESEINRTARFKTVITYYHNETYVQFTGITEGEIINTPQGNQGFGYDPIFIPSGSSKTYAEMTLEEKNRFSHRKKSFDSFANYLSNNSV
ncbi:MAG: RdgB/HAM1 family non-canonical purine NTP pyrophosphatase [Chitinophagales bacterium]|nr:RdgB/HAM1 family non-canonical purine NTP pyrophosphatase [Chitinophagales bacterium]